MTTKIKIENSKDSNGDLVLDGVCVASEGSIRGAVLQPGQSREVWITSNSTITLTEQWPAIKTLAVSDVDLLRACGDDGAAWATEYAKRNPVDEEIARMWFQNAIETACAKRLAWRERQPISDDVAPSHRGPDNAG